MPRYRCENCDELRDTPVCPKCQADTQLLDDAELDDLASRVSRQAAAAEAPRPKPVSPAVEPPPPPPPPAPAPAPLSQNVVGLEEFHALLDRGGEAVIICGDSQSGKSHIAAGYIRAMALYRGASQNPTLRTTIKDDTFGATNPGEIWYQIIDDKRVFLDPSGEFFHQLATDVRQRIGLGVLTEADFVFLQRAVSRLAGIVLVFDLTSAVDPRSSAPWRRQEDDLKFVLSALRWFRFERDVRPDAIGLSANIAQRVSRFPRLDRRVLVLFSKADQLAKFTNQSPLEFARKRLPVLHAALMTHAGRFRYDFCNTMIKTESGDQAADPCGVLLPMTWLLDRSFGWLPQLPTKVIGGGR
jgi:hypothetical protein